MNNAVYARVIRIFETILSVINHILYGMMTKEAKTLYVQTFREFALTYGGKPIAPLSRYGSTQPEQLLQLLLHYRKTGVSRRMLLRELFDDREVLDVSHSLHVLRYNLCAKLRSAGLPDAEYVVREGDIFYWTNEIPVEEDAAIFEQLCQQAEAESSPAVRRQLYEQACALYHGEFLEGQSASWSVQEAQRYERLYGTCVNALAALLRQAADFGALEALGREATKSQPYWGWERLTMEALLEQGKLQNARKLYLATERCYRQDMNLPPDKQMQALYRQYWPTEAGSVPHPSKLKESVASSQVEECGYLCEYPAFAAICEMAKRWQKGALLLTAQSAASDERTAMLLTRTVQRLLRPTDAVTRADDNRYFLLLTDVTETSGQSIRLKLQRECEQANLPSLSGWQSQRLGEK